MTQTIVGLFDTVSKAESAVAGLMNGGFDREHIDLVTVDEEVVPDTSDTDDRSVGGLLGALFGSDDTSQADATGEQRQSTVTVHAQSDDMADRAADILDACGAIDIDEKGTESEEYTTQVFPGTVPPVTADPAGGVSGYTSAHTHESAVGRDRDPDQ